MEEKDQEREIDEDEDMKLGEDVKPAVKMKLGEDVKLHDEAVKFRVKTADEAEVVRTKELKA